MYAASEACTASRYSNFRLLLIWLAIFAVSFPLSHWIFPFVPLRPAEEAAIQFPVMAYITVYFFLVLGFVFLTNLAEKRVRLTGPEIRRQVFDFFTAYVTTLVLMLSLGLLLNSRLTMQSFFKPVPGALLYAISVMFTPPCWSRRWRSCGNGNSF